MPSDLLFSFTETCGLRHEPQILEIDLPSGDEALLIARNLADGSLHPVQRSLKNPLRGFLLLDIGAHEKLELVLDSMPFSEAKISNPVAVQEKGAVLTNGLLSLRVLIGEATFSQTGPVIAHRFGSHAWRGRTFFDARQPIVRSTGQLVENGPLRLVYQFRAETAEKGFYEADLTVDAGQNWIRVDERFELQTGDQLIWDYTGADLPDAMRLLDSTAGYFTRPLYHHMDQRHARLWAWTQQSQLLDLSDGYAWTFSDGNDSVGAVTLAGGDWRGNKLNHLEAWTRRWIGDDASTRRLVPADAKADSFPSPERIPARGNSICVPHFSLEGWIGTGQRSWALVLCERTQLGAEDNPDSPAHGKLVELAHFEVKPVREIYARQQSLLRKIHTQHGMFPLEEQIPVLTDWPLEPKRSPELGPLVGYHFRTRQFDPETEGALDTFRDYMAARIYGFWEGSGSAYTNCVVSRHVAPYMFYFEWLVFHDKLSEAETRQIRAWFAFLAGLFSTDNYYIGASTMEPVESFNSVEPTIQGMANQNFYTDIINLPGTAAQIFHRHPLAKHWRDKFAAMWDRQLEYHVYPESGLWEESHTYYLHVLHTVHDLLRRRREDGVGDGFASAGFLKMIAAALKQFTPPDRYFANRRYLMSIGDHFPEVARGNHLAAYAEDVLPHDPKLAGELAWGAQEMGVEPPSGIQPTPISWKNGYLQGLGYFFRGESHASGQTVLALRSGTAWAHHHHDEGGIQFYAYGQALVIDAAFSHPPEGAGQRKVNAEGHSRVTAPEYDALNHLWRFNRGWLVEHRADGPLPYAIAWMPTHMSMGPQNQPTLLRRPRNEYRVVVQLEADAYLVSDVRLGATPASLTRLQVPEGRLEIIGESARVDYEHVALDISAWGGAGFKPGREDFYLEEGKPTSPTREIYSMTHQSWSGFLLSASVPGSPVPQVEQKGDEVQVAFRGKTWKLARKSLNEFEIEGNGASQSLKLPY